MDTHLISIVIPCYNQAHFLPRAIKSCLTQTYQHLEIIVVDDGSPDNVAVTVRPYMDKIKLIRQENKGLAMARNRGLDEAKGVFIKFLDADDWLYPDCINLQYRSLRSMPRHFSVIGHHLSYTKNNGQDDDIYPEFGKISYQLCCINTGPPHTFLYTTDSIRAIKGFTHIDGGHEDYDLICRLTLNGYEIVSVHIVGCSYTKYPGSMSTCNKGMQKSRKTVWLAFVRQLLNTASTLAPEQFVHIFCGYVQRFGCEDIKYEAIDILKETVFHLTSTSTLNERLILLLADNLILLQKLTPKKEKIYPIEQSIQVKYLNELHAHIIEHYPTDLLKNIKRSTRLIGLLSTHLWVNRSQKFCYFIRRLQSIRFPRFFWIVPCSLAETLLNLIDRH